MDKSQPYHHIRYFLTSQIAFWIVWNVLKFIDYLWGKYFIANEKNQEAVRIDKNWKMKMVIEMEAPETQNATGNHQPTQCLKSQEGIGKYWISGINGMVMTDEPTNAAALG